jgi:D-alanyl-D-alanine carboxypeptidase
MSSSHHAVSYARKKRRNEYAEVSFPDCTEFCAGHREHFIYNAFQHSNLFAGDSPQDGGINLSASSVKSLGIQIVVSSSTSRNTCSDLLVLVDKSDALPASYVPPDLVSLHDYGIPVTNYTIMGRHSMIDELQKLIADSTSAGFDLVVASAYRSYATQESIYSTYVRDYGEREANIFSAKLGESQHQLGTAIDFTTPEMGDGLSQAFAYSEAGKWLLINAYKYGFYLSYPQGQESVTGYEYEPWHFRYLGVQNTEDFQHSGQIMQTCLQHRGITPHC